MRLRSIAKMSAVVLGLLSLSPSALAAPDCTLEDPSAGYVLDCGTGDVLLGAGTGFTIGPECANWRARGPFLGFFLVGSQECPQGADNRLGCDLGPEGAGWLLDCGTGPTALGYAYDNGVGLTLGEDCANVRFQTFATGFVLVGDDPCPA